MTHDDFADTEPMEGFEDTDILGPFMRCDNCGNIFQDPDVWDEVDVLDLLDQEGWEPESDEDHEFLKQHLAEEVGVERCPDCKSTDVYDLSAAEYREFGL